MHLLQTLKSQWANPSLNVAALAIVLLIAAACGGSYGGGTSAEPDPASGEATSQASPATETVRPPGEAVSVEPIATPVLESAPAPRFRREKWPLEIKARRPQPRVIPKDLPNAS